LELHVRCSVASRTFHSKISIMEVVVLGPFGNSSSGIFNLVFSLDILGLRFSGKKWGVEIDVSNLRSSGSFGIGFSYPCSHLQHGRPLFFSLQSLFSRWT